MSDLQCPARFLVVAVSTPGEVLVESLRHERVAAVYDVLPHADAAREAAAAWGLPLQAIPRRPSVEDVLSRDPGTLALLEDLADLHRGENVVVAAEGAAGRRVDVSVDGDGVGVEEVSPGAAR